MNASKASRHLVQALVAAAAAGMFGGVCAQEEGFPGSGIVVGIGAGAATGNKDSRARFGLYNGLRDRDQNLLLDFTYQRLDDSAGTWMTLTGRDLALDNRELAYSFRRFGDYRVTLDYSEITRHDPRTINTSLAGAGSTNPVVSPGGLAAPGSGQDLNLELKRKGLGLNVEKWLSPELQLEMSFKNEDKKGARLFGRGFACSTNWRDVGACAGTTAAAVLMLPEPIDSTIQQADARLNFTSAKLNFTVGYYGSFYTNRLSNLTPTIVGPFGNQNGGAQAADAGLTAVLSQPMALTPDNQAHQLFFSGNYRLTPKTKINFKYAYTRATQKEDFGAMGLLGGPAGRTDLGGQVDTSRGQVGFSSQPWEKVHLHGDLVVEQKRNKTPIAVYNSFYTCPGVYTPATRTCSVPWVTATYSNGNASPKKWHAKLEGSYRLPYDVVATAGVKYEREDFGSWTPTDLPGGVSGLKQKLSETGYRAELRRTMSENLTGSIGYESARRVGLSPWQQPNNFTTGANTGVTEVSDAAIYSRTAIFPFIYMDRERNKLKFSANWMPADRLSVQVFGDTGRDLYHAPTDHGLRATRTSSRSIDASYTLSEVWKLNAYASNGKQMADSGHSTGYDAILRDTANSVGFGVRGTPLPKLQVGLDVTWISDKLEYEQVADQGSSAANRLLLSQGGGLPDVTYRMNRVSLFGEYAFEKNSAVRLDLVHYSTFFNEWTYQWNGTPYLFSDNTTIRAQEKQSVTFLGVRYIHKFQ